MYYQFVIISLIAVILLSWVFYFLKIRKLNYNNNALLNDIANARITIENLIEGAGRILIITDLVGNIVTWNKNASSTFGYPRDFILNKHIQLLDLENDAWNFQSIVDEVPLSGELKYLEFQKKTSTGKVVDLIATATSLKNSKGEPYLINFSMEDFSERNQLMHLRVNREKLLAGIESLNKLLATLSHYINNSITSISGMAQLVELDEKYSAKFVSVTKIQIQKIQAVLKSLSVLVDSLNLKTRDYVGDKGMLFDIENEITSFLQTFEKKPQKKN